MPPAIFAANRIHVVPVVKSPSYTKGARTNIERVIERTESESGLVKPQRLMPTKNGSGVIVRNGVAGDGGLEEKLALHERHTKIIYAHLLSKDSRPELNIATIWSVSDLNSAMHFARDVTRSVLHLDMAIGLNNSTL